MVLELDDLGPGLARGLVMAASLSDSTGSMTLRVFTEAALPVTLVQQFLSEAQDRLPPKRNGMSDELRRALFEDLAVIRDRSASSAREALSGEGPVWAERPQAFDRLRALVRSPEDVGAFASAVEEFVHVALHSTLVVIDGGTASAEIGRVRLVDEGGEPLGEGLHELFVDHLFDTGRVE